MSGYSGYVAAAVRSLRWQARFEAKTADSLEDESLVYPLSFPTRDNKGLKKSFEWTNGVALNIVVNPQ